MNKRTRSFKIFTVCMLCIFLCSSTLMTVASAGGIGYQNKDLFRNNSRYQGGFEKPNAMDYEKLDDSEEQTGGEKVDEKPTDKVQKPGKTIGNIVDSIIDVFVGPYFK